MKKTIFFSALLCALTLSAEVLWKADFSKNLAGFAIKRQVTKADSIKVENGEFVLLFHHGPHKGIDIQQEIPYPERGELSFDAIMNVGNKPGYNTFSVKLTLFGKTLAWNGIHNWGLATYTPPSKWDIISKIPYNKKINYRFRFDRVKGTLDVFIDGSLIPVKSFTGVKFAAPQNGKGVLSIANYGYATGKMTHKISNLKLEGVASTAPVTEAKTVWKENFSKEGTLQDNGYKQEINNKKDLVTVKNGELTFVCQNSPYKGSMFTKTIPGVVRGELTFEASVGDGNGYNHLSLHVGFGNISFSWRPTRAWQLYHPKENKWYNMTSQVSNGQWHKYMIRFDAVRKTAEYYVNDMSNPVFIDTKSEFVPSKEITFRIRNYGLCSGSIVNKLRNIELKEIPEQKKNDSKTLSGVMFFQGVSSDEWKARDFVKRLGEKKIDTYTLLSVGSHTTNDNPQFVVQPKPSPNRGMPKYIVLSDFPAKPIPDYCIKMIRESVENGGHLIILDGLFTLGKGEFAGTILEDILPVSVKDRWKEAKPLPGASFLKHKGKNVVVYKKVGKGIVYIVLGNAVKDPSLAEVLNQFKF